MPAAEQTPIHRSAFRVRSPRTLHSSGVAALVLLAMLLVPPASAVDFAHEVVPILRQHCGECHTGNSAQGALSMNTRELLLKGGEQGAVIVPKDAAASRLLELVTTTDESIQMPPEGPRLTDQQVATLRNWIDAGGPWEAGFRFDPETYEVPLRPRSPELPAAREGQSEHPIDRIVDRYLLEHEVPWPTPLDDATFVRRVSLDLVGLLPSDELLDLATDPKLSTTDRRAQIIDRLLADKVAYADHWLTFWNDLLRNDYVGTGYIDGGRKQISEWLYNALATNMPYDQFTRQLIAPPTPDSAGFIAGIKWRGGVNASQVREIQFSQNVSQVFLGINMKCASCHDSFIDNWTLEQAYGLAAVYSQRPLEIHRCDKPTGQQAAAAWIFPELGNVDPDAAQPERLRQLADLIVHPENGRTTRTIVNRLWERLMGRGIVHPVDSMGTRPWEADLLDHLASDLAAHGYDLKHTLRQIVTSRIYQSQSIIESADNSSASSFVFRGPIAKRMTAEQFIDAVWQLTGTAPNSIVPGNRPKPKDGPRPENPIAALRGDATVRASLVVSDLLMRSLGRPNREQVVTTRPADLSTLQAIDLTNGPELSALLQQGAERIVATKKPADKLIGGLFLNSLSRTPTSAEQAAALAIVQREDESQSETNNASENLSVSGVEDLLWAVWMLPEFQIVR